MSDLLRLYDGGDDGAINHQKNNNNNNNNSSSSSSSTITPPSSWTTLTERLSEPRADCSAVTVHDRFLVVMGGSNREHLVLASVDILDTKFLSCLDKPSCPPSSATTTIRTTSTALSSGPCLLTGRSHFGAAQVLGDDHKIWVFGGEDENIHPVNSLECLELGPLLAEDNHHPAGNGTTATTDSVCLAPWKSVMEYLNFGCGSGSSRRYFHSLVPMGKQCLVAAAGFDEPAFFRSAIVIDPYRQVVWSLFDLKIPRSVCSMVCLPNQELLVLGGIGLGAEDTMESLPFVELSLSALKASDWTLQNAMKQISIQLDHSMDSSNNNKKKGTTPFNNEPEQKNIGLLKGRYDLLKERRSRLQSLYKTLLFFVIFENPQSVIHSA